MVQTDIDPFRNDCIWLWIRLKLAAVGPAGNCFDNACFVYTDESTEPPAESKAEALVSKRPIETEDKSHI